MDDDDESDEDEDLVNAVSRSNDDLGDKGKRHLDMESTEESEELARMKKVRRAEVRRNSLEKKKAKDAGLEKDVRAEEQRKSREKRKAKDAGLEKDVPPHEFTHFS